MVHAKKGLSSCQLSRDVGLSHITAWRIAMKIRRAMASVSDDGKPFRGILEMDTTWGRQPSPSF